MATLAASTAILCRRESAGASSRCSTATSSSKASMLPLPTSSRSWRSGGVFVAAAGFWADLSQRPASVEMEEIDGVEALDEALRLSLEQSQPIIIDWMASWCRKCIYLKPKLEKLAAEYYPRLKFYFVDVNKVSQALVKRGNVSKMPTIQLWKDGEWKAEVIGGHKAWLVMDEIREMIQKHI